MRKIKQMQQKLIISTKKTKINNKLKQYYKTQVQQLLSYNTRDN